MPVGVSVLAMAFSWFASMCAVLGVCATFGAGCGDDDGAAARDAGNGGASGQDAATGVDAATAGSSGADAATNVPMLPACNLVCDRVLDCATESCVGYSWMTAGFAQGVCAEVCGDAFNSAVMAAADCAGVLSVMRASSMPLTSLCDGQCAEVAACDAYAQKLSGCAVDHCDGNADDYQPAIAAVLSMYCAEADDCPSPETVAYLNDDALGCDDPVLAPVGPAAPFTSICDGTVGATMVELLAACDRLMTCVPGTFASAEYCAGLIAVGENTAAKVTCIDGAAGCAEVLACL